MGQQTGLQHESIRQQTGLNMKNFTFCPKITYTVCFVLYKLEKMFHIFAYSVFFLAVSDEFKIG
jgi:hypothetical protein